MQGLQKIPVEIRGIDKVMVVLHIASKLEP